MNLLIIAACALAISSANPIVYNGPLHYPVINNGVPVETEEVQHAKALHYEAIAKEVARTGYQQYQEPKYEEQDHAIQVSNQQPRYVQSYNSGYSQNVAQYKPTYQTGYVNQYSEEYVPTYQTGHVSQYSQKQVESVSHVIPQIGHDGKPLDTAEVEAAKAQHFAAVYQALERAASQKPKYRHRRGIYEHSPIYSGPQHFPVITKEGVPEDTLEVQHARAEHLAALSAEDVKGYNGYTIKQEHYPTVKYHGPEHIPVITKEGVPEDTLEVQHARAEHLAALSAEDVKGYNGYTIKQEHYPTVKYHGPEHIPVITKEGVPEDTLEVQHARAEHLAALSAEDVKGYNEYTIEQEHYPTANYHGAEHVPVITKGGVPVDTLEVQKARSEHLAAISGDKLKGTFGFSIHQVHAPVYGYHGHEVPAIGHDGTPLETAEVEHAKAAHFAAHHEALARISNNQEYHQTENYYEHHY